MLTCHVAVVTKQEGPAETELPDAGLSRILFHWGRVLCQSWQIASSSASHPPQQHVTTLFILVHTHIHCGDTFEPYLQQRLLTQHQTWIFVNENWNVREKNHFEIYLNWGWNRALSSLSNLFLLHKTHPENTHAAASTWIHRINEDNELR